MLALCGRGAVGVAAYSKSKIISILIIKNPPKCSAARTWQQRTGGGYRHVIIQTAGQIQAAEPAAPPQEAQPRRLKGPVIRFGMRAIRGASWNCRKHNAAAGAAEPHRLHSISDSCNLIELLIMIFAEFNVCPLQAAISLTQSCRPAYRPSSLPFLSFPVCCFTSKHRHDPQLFRCSQISELPHPLFPPFSVFLSRISICISQ